MPEPSELVEVIQRRFRCRHIHAAGHQCGSPALRHEQFCYYHHATRRPAPAAGKYRFLDSTEPFALPVVEDRTSALAAASMLLSRIASNDLDVNRAGKLLYNLQIITALLPREPGPAADTGESTDLAPTPEPLVENTVLDETLGILAPVTELFSLDTASNGSATLPILQAVATPLEVVIPANPDSPYFNITPASPGCTTFSTMSVIADELTNLLEVGIASDMPDLNAKNSVSRLVGTQNGALAKNRDSRFGLH